MINVKYDDATIKEKRAAVAKSLFKASANINSEKIDSIGILDLRILYECYDKIFFNNWFGKNFRGQVLYELSRRMTKSAGMTKCPKNVSQLKPEQIRIVIAISPDFFFNFDYLEGSKSVGGIETHSSLEALQIVFEHELVHVLEFLLFHTSNCSRPRFKATARDLFGHTQSHHQLPTNRRIVSEKFGVNIGDKVQFLFEGRKLNGFVANISKRATVMVASSDGSYRDRNGKRYIKYYVPVGALTKQFLEE